MDFKKRYRNDVMKKIRERDKRIKVEFVESGDYDLMIKAYRKKKSDSEKTTKIDELPF